MGTTKPTLKQRRADTEDLARQVFGQATVDFDRQNDSYTPSEHFIATLHTDHPIIPKHKETGYTKSEALDKLAVWILNQKVKGQDE